MLDIVGTGGDGIGSVNISTGATVIAAAAGAKVAKHGSRSGESRGARVEGTDSWADEVCCSRGLPCLPISCRRALPRGWACPGAWRRLSLPLPSLLPPCSVQPLWQC